MRLQAALASTFVFFSIASAAVATPVQANLGGNAGDTTKSVATVAKGCEWAPGIPCGSHYPGSGRR